MLRLRLKFLLPVLQVIIAIVLFRLAQQQIRAVGRFFDSPYVPTATLVLNGINAPTHIPKVILINLLQLLSATWSYLNSDLERVSFLSCIFGLWYLVGRELDNLRTSHSASPVRAHSIPWNFSLMGLGIFLAAFSVINFSHLQDLARWNNFIGNAVEGFLFWLWSLILLFISGRGIVRNFRAHRTRVDDSFSTD